MEAYFVFELFIVAFTLFDCHEYLGHLVETMSVPGWSKQRKEPFFPERNLSFAIESLSLSLFLLFIYFFFFFATK